MLPVLTELVEAVSARPGTFTSPTKEQQRDIEALLGNLSATDKECKNRGIGGLSASIAAASILADAWKAGEPSDAVSPADIAKNLVIFSGALGDFDMSGKKVTKKMLDSPKQAAEILLGLRTALLSILDKPQSNKSACASAEAFLSNAGDLIFSKNIGSNIGQAMSAATYYTSSQSRNGREFHPWPEIAFMSNESQESLRLALAAQILTGVIRYERLDDHPDVQKLIAPDWKGYVREIAASAIRCANQIDRSATEPASEQQSVMWMMTAMREGMLVSQVVESNYFSLMAGTLDRNNGIQIARGIAEALSSEYRRQEWVNRVQDKIIQPIEDASFGDPSVAIKTRAAVMRGMLAIKVLDDEHNGRERRLLNVIPDEQPTPEQARTVERISSYFKEGMDAALEAMHRHIHESAVVLGNRMGGDVTLIHGWENLLRSAARNTILNVSDVADGHLTSKTNHALSNMSQWAGELAGMPAGRQAEESKAQQLVVVEIGTRIIYSPYEKNLTVSTGDVEGIVIARQPTNSGDIRYRLSIDKKVDAEEGGYSEMLVYANQGDIKVLDTGISVNYPA